MEIRSFKKGDEIPEGAIFMASLVEESYTIQMGKDEHSTYSNKIVHYFLVPTL